MAITFRQLRHFVVLAEHMHFGKAAQALNISQPPLSASLKQLEQALGYDLMARSRKSVRLTAAGAVFAEQARQILEQLNTATAMGRDVALGSAGSVSVGFVPSMLFRGLPALLRRFEETHPQITLTLCEKNTAHQIADMQRHKIDVGFIHAVPLPEMLVEHRLGGEALVCCVHRAHRLAGLRRIELRKLANEKVIVFSREFAPQYHDKIVALLKASDIEPFLGYDVQHWLTVVALVSQGLGVSLVPRSLALAGLGDVSFVDVVARNAQHDVSLVWHQAGTNEATAFFVEFARRFGMFSAVGAAG
ncbi:MAG: LysR substrate-binding domain-containing protein [Hyphomicrobiaceae bacterium]